MKFFQNWRSGTYSIAVPLAVFLAATAYFALLYFNNAVDAAQHGIIVQVDEAVVGFLSGFRIPVVVRFFSIVTAFGNWGVVLALAMTVAILLWLNHKPGYVIGMWIALAGNQISVNLLKVIFARARPQLAYYSESTLSFPSGHSAVSAAFFGFLIYLLIRERIMAAGMAMAVGTLAILAVGISRLILGQHYLSDVLNGYLVGALWALLAIWLAERSRAIADPAITLPLSRWRHGAKFAVVGLAVIVVWVLVSRYQGNLLTLPVARVAP